MQHAATLKKQKISEFLEDVTKELSSLANNDVISVFFKILDNKDLLNSAYVRKHGTVNVIIKAIKREIKSLKTTDVIALCSFKFMLIQKAIKFNAKHGGKLWKKAKTTISI
jgi:delta-aminolevulinic acid dehydratase/porphobilinogen synthase